MQPLPGRLRHRGPWLPSRLPTLAEVPLLLPEDREPPPMKQPPIPPLPAQSPGSCAVWCQSCGRPPLPACPLVRKGAAERRRPSAQPQGGKPRFDASGRPRQSPFRTRRRFGPTKGRSPRQSHTTSTLRNYSSVLSHWSTTLRPEGFLPAVRRLVLSLTGSNTDINPSGSRGQLSCWEHETRNAAVARFAAGQSYETGHTTKPAALDQAASVRRAESFAKMPPLAPSTEPRRCPRELDALASAAPRGP